MKINHTSLKSAPLAITASLLIIGGAAAENGDATETFIPDPRITTVDVIAVQRHFLNIGTPLTGCKLLAADVNGSNTVNTQDVLSINSYFLGNPPVFPYVTGQNGGCDIYGNVTP